MISLFSCYQTLFHIIYLLQLLSLQLCFFLYVRICSCFSFALCVGGQSRARGAFSEALYIITPNTLSSASFPHRKFFYAFSFSAGSWIYIIIVCIICFLSIFHTFFRVLELQRERQIFRELNRFPSFHNCTVATLHFSMMLLCLQKNGNLFLPSSKNINKILESYVGRIHSFIHINYVTGRQRE